MSSTPPPKAGIPIRRHPRYSAYQDLAVIYEGHSQKIPVRAPDISPQGIFIHTQQHFPEGAILCIEFRLVRTNFTVNARAEVRYCLPGVGVGVEFVDISPEAQRTIEEELSALGHDPQTAL
jgi:hypothetical protein